MARTQQPRKDSRPEPRGCRPPPAGAPPFAGAANGGANGAADGATARRPGPALLCLVLLAGLIAAAAGPRAPQTAPAGAHLTVADPAALDGARAEAVYQAIRAGLAARYAEAGDPVTLAYRGWRRFNRAPYRSKAHGERFVNNYANEAARGYGRFEAVGVLPEGAIVAKDSFVVTAGGQVLTGPFFLMEKRYAGFNPAARDWLFMMVGADGRLVGITGGAGSEKVAFCGRCHAKAPAGQDGLWLPPPKARRR